jgi:hypothetical protein
MIEVKINYTPLIHEDIKKACVSENALAS